MHIVDGVLSAPVLISGACLSLAGIAYGLKKLEYDHLPQVAVLSAVFFIASYIHLPVGLSSVHLILNGLIGLSLGWSAFPALFVALVLQAVFFGFGGFLVLGVNTFNVALPAILMFLLCRNGLAATNPKVAAIWGAVGGGGSILLTSLLVAMTLALSGEHFILAAQVSVLAHIPIMIVEAFVTSAAILLIRKVKPEMLNLPEDWRHV